MIQKNIERLKQRIANTCRKAGRAPGEVRLIAVSKTFDAARIEEAMTAGLEEFGENYVQELRRKALYFLGRQVRWHFIGHLQTNKVKYIVDSVSLIHSLDSARLAEEIQKRARGTVEVLVEVHTTDEATKTGVPPENVIGLLKEISRFEKVSVRGLMTMGPFSEDPNASRPAFRVLSDLKRLIEAEGIEGVAMNHLSMGMTHDFEVAIEEGATMVRIGTAIFGKRT